MKKNPTVYLTKTQAEQKGLYIWRFSHIGFNGTKGASAPMRENEQLDEWDSIFASKKDFDEWFRKTNIGLAELDESMNFCQYFVREKGNEGRYEREGKSFPVDGTWTGIQDFDNYPPAQLFVKWLEKNGWRNDWFKLHERYV